MAMNAFGIVKSFDVLEYQTICLPVVMYFKPGVNPKFRVNTI